MYWSFFRGEQQRILPTPIFSAVLSYLQLNPLKVQVKQKGEKLTFVAIDISQLQEVHEMLESIVKLEKPIEVA